MSRLRSIATKLAVVLASTLLALGLGECVVRGLLPAYDPAGKVHLVRQGELLLGVPDSRARQRKNTGDYDVEVRFGPRGFRDPRDVAAAEALDLLAVGGSLAFGLFTVGIHRAGPLEALAESLGLVQPNLGAVGMEKVPEAAIAATADRVAALAQGYDTTVLLVPSRALWLERSAVEANRTHRAMVATLVARGFAVVDPRAAFEATGEPLAVHFAKDGHWNERGHRIAAECLARR